VGGPGLGDLAWGILIEGEAVGDTSLFPYERKLLQPLGIG
jgi:hypothetical protein